MISLTITGAGTVVQESQRPLSSALVLSTDAGRLFLAGAKTDQWVPIPRTYYAACVPRGEEFGTQLLVAFVPAGLGPHTFPEVLLATCPEPDCQNGGVHTLSQITDEMAAELWAEE